MKSRALRTLGPQGPVNSNSVELAARLAASVVLFAVAFFIGIGCREAGVEAPTDSEVPHTSGSKLHDYLPIMSDLNFIVVSFDAMRPDVLAPYGGDRSTTPNIADFSARSLVFENAYSVAPVTPTSFAAFFSGMLPTKVFHAWKFKAETTLAGEFSRAGYLTAAFINNVQLTPEREFGNGFNLYEWRRNHADKDLVKEVLAWIGNTRNQRFFLWIHFLHPHAPYMVVPGAEHLYTEKAFGRFAVTTGNTFEATNEHEIARIKELYLGEVWTADQLFGEVIDRIQELGLMQKTVVVLTSDHGEEFSEHGDFQHGRLYEEHLRIPFIMYHPQGSPGRIDDVRFQSIDLLPTLLHLAGHPMVQAFDGKDLLLNSRHLSQPPVVGISMTGAEDRSASILDGSQKLIVTCGSEQRVELFDLEIDPFERDNIANLNNDVVVALFQSLSRFLGGGPCEVMARAARGIDQTDGLDKESLDALRALGYIE